MDIKHKQQPSKCTYIHAHTLTVASQGTEECTGMGINTGPLWWHTFSAFDPGKEYAVQSSQGVENGRNVNIIYASTNHGSHNKNRPF